MKAVVMFLNRTFIYSDEGVSVTDFRLLDDFIQFYINVSKEFIMRKSIFSVAPVVLTLLVGTGVAQAASNAQVTITANVVASTCDVSISTANLDLGNHAAAEFTAVATPIANSVKNFTLGLNNCAAPTVSGDTASLIVSGQTLAANPNMFNSTGTNTGIMISAAATPTAYISAGDKLLIATAGAIPAAGDFNAKTLSMQAALASTSTTPDLGMVNAPILFSFSYN